ncbi:MAG: hypothetical protein R2822_02965 [Spirosomataceae bacterium]
MLQKQFIRHLIARGFMVIFALMLLNGIVFRHAHRLSSGKVITHAHPYKLNNPSGPYQPNDHTANELFLLDMFSNAAFVGLTLTVVVAPVKRVLAPQFTYQFSYLSVAYHTPSLGRFSPRGPPIH